MAGRRHVRPRSARAYARQLVLRRWHSAAQWQAEDSIVSGESHWDPCAVNPGMHACGYAGASSCGIPQANPCPTGWRGHLYETRFQQVVWLQHYIAGRYGDPLHALWFHKAHGWY